MTATDHLAAVRDAADDVRSSRQQLIAAMSDAITGGVPAEHVALAAMRAEPPYALMIDVTDERAPGPQWPARKAS